MNTFVLLVFLVVCGSPSFCQTSRTLDLAKAYESDGDFEKALALYEDLYRRDSANLVIIERLKTAYKITGKNELRIPVLRLQLKNDSLNLVIWTELADAYFRTKRLKDAEWAVARALGINEQEAVTYRIVATMMLENRWLEPVEEVYFMARRQLKNDNLFTLDLASLYTYRGQYYKAAREYLRHHRIKPDALEYVRNQILQLPRDDSSYAAVVRALEEEMVGKKDDPLIRRLLIDTHFQQRDYDRAFQQSKILDQVHGKGGLEILNFANATFQNQLYQVALKAYLYFLNEYPNAPQAEMGVARCFENMGMEGDSPAVDTLRAGSLVRENYFSTKAIESYRSIIQKYKSSEWSAEAYYRTGDIFFQKFFDVDEALTNYRKALEEFPGSPYRASIQFRIGECRMVQGKLEEVRRQASDILKESRSVEVSDRAAFVLGELYFFEENFDSSKAVFGRMANRRDGLYVNDALNYVLLLQESTKEPEWLKSFARAMRIGRQQKYSEAYGHLTTLAKQLPEDSPLLDDVLYQCAQMLIRQKKYSEAVGIMEGIVANLVDCPITDLCQKAIAEVYDYHLKDHALALTKYREFLMRFPKSIYAEEIRKRLRQLEHIQKKSS